MHENNSFSGGSGSDALLMANLLRHNPNALLGTSTDRIKRFFCHGCRRIFFTSTQSDTDIYSITCEHCGSGFVEEMALNPLALHHQYQSGRSSRQNLLTPCLKRPFFDTLLIYNLFPFFFV